MAATCWTSGTEGFLGWLALSSPVSHLPTDRSYAPTSSDNPDTVTPWAGRRQRTKTLSRTDGPSRKGPRLPVPITDLFPLHESARLGHATTVPGGRTSLAIDRSVATRGRHWQPTSLRPCSASGGGCSGGGRQGAGVCPTPPDMERTGDDRSTIVGDVTPTPSGSGDDSLAGPERGDLQTWGTERIPDVVRLMCRWLRGLPLGRTRGNRVTEFTTRTTPRRRHRLVGGLHRGSQCSNPLVPAEPASLETGGWPSCSEFDRGRICGRSGCCLHVLARCYYRAQQLGCAALPPH